MEGFDESNAPVAFYPRKMAEAIELARMNDADDEPLVKNCGTCLHFCGTLICGRRTEGGLCKKHDALTLRKQGKDCQQWEGKYGRKTLMGGK
jgi:hypothetical protein